MDIALYAERINYERSMEPSFATLRALHLAHLLTVPFENLDIHVGRRIRLDRAALFDKIVKRRRGGFCYELNGLFALLLERLGFVVTLLSASDAHDDETYGPEFDHLTLSVQCPDKPSVSWLADVGWGDTFREPLRLAWTSIQAQGPRAYRIDQEGDYRILWQRDYDGRWERQYRFTLQPRSYSDFALMCHYHQTLSESPFTQNRICTLATVDGRITLDPSRFIMTTNGERRERPIENEDSYSRLLEEEFGIRL